MTFMSKHDAALIKELVRIAGSAALVESSLRELNQELGSSPTVEQLVLRILEKRADALRETNRRSKMEPVAAG